MTHPQTALFTPDAMGDAGRALTARSRLVLSGLRPGAAKLFAVPTAKSAYCWFLTTNGTPECLNELEDDLVTLSLMRYRGHIVVYGLAADTVKAVSVVGPRTVPARMGRNAFYCLLAVPTGQVKALLITGTIGSHYRIPLDPTELKAMARHHR